MRESRHIAADRPVVVIGAGVFWPEATHPLARLIASGNRPASSDHRLVWVDIALP